MAKQWREGENRLLHDGDCYYWAKRVCTCGLLHHLMPNADNPEWFWDEMTLHDAQLRSLPHRPEIREPTEEEKKRIRYLKKFLEWRLHRRMSRTDWIIAGIIIGAFIVVVGGWILFSFLSTL